MRTYLGLLTNAVRSALRSKHDLMLENLALRQQLAVLTRQRARTRTKPADRLFCGPSGARLPGVLSELRARMTRSEAPSLLPCLRRRHFGDQCMPAPDEASSLLGRGDDLAAATASAQVLAELLKR